MKTSKVLVVAGAVWLGITAAGGYISYRGLLGNNHPWPEVHPEAVPVVEIQERQQRQEAPLLARTATTNTKQILFGDLHVHTTLSVDAYQMSMPYMQGEGLYPVADACDFARYCSAMDFWSINDHAEGLTPDAWNRTKQSIRDCNAVTDPENPDVVAYLGYEWSQAGNSPSNHYGHKNVVLLEQDEDKVPTHPIAAENPDLGPRGFTSPWFLRALSGLNFSDPDYQRYQDYNKYTYDMEQVKPCEDVPYDQLDEGCIPFAATPDRVFELLQQWGGESIVIPHGNTWGLYSPAGTSWDKQLEGEMHDDDRQILLEVFSGHGNSEEYRDWNAVGFDEQGKAYCPETTESFTPGCRQAGLIITARCLVEGNTQAECDSRADVAQQHYVDSGSLNFMTVPGTGIEDWEDSSQCKDCYLPTFRYRPRGSSQYAMAIRNFDDPENPRRFRFGFMASSDNHKAKAGPGYKEYARAINTESGPGLRDKERDLILGKDQAASYSRKFEASLNSKGGVDPQLLLNGSLMLFERQSSFFYTGGLIAAHSEGRRREDIWDAMQKREVYATSGGHTLLWFDHIENGQTNPMGSEVISSENPTFRVTAMGDFKQLPGCPDYTTSTLSPDRVEGLCRGECYNPAQERALITRIDVIRIRPQIYKDEPVAPLIDDVWKSFDCPEDRNGCTVEFTDEDYADSTRDAIYYVRVQEEAKPMVNGGQLNLERDLDGKVVAMNDCDRHKSPGDDCLAMETPKAWSSPIFVGFQAKPIEL